METEAKREKGERQIKGKKASQLRVQCEISRTSSFIGRKIKRLQSLESAFDGRFAHENPTRSPSLDLLAR